MTSPTSPPNRRRRRIVVMIAVLVVGQGWWFWPQVDQRFVGTREWSDDTGRGIVQLTSDRVFRWISREGEPDGRTTTWSVSGNCLVIGDDASCVPLKKLLQPIAATLVSMFGRLALIESDEVMIVRISENEILLKSPYTDDIGQEMLRRIRE
jgi:hypothetical protein